MSYTPRQAVAFAKIMAQREKENAANSYKIQRNAFHNDDKQSENFISELAK